MQKTMQKTIRNKTGLALACGAILLTAGVCAAQSEGAKPAPEQPKYFHLEFVVKDLEGGKVINARHYSTTVSTDGSCTIRTGNKVPVPTGTGTGTDSQFQFTYIDVGVNIDCRSAKQVEGNLALNLTAEISSAVTATKPPLIRQNKWSSNVIVPVGKPTVVFSSDDVTSKGQMQLELTATPIEAR
jgi:hypothetical protein